MWFVELVVLAAIVVVPILAARAVIRLGMEPQREARIEAERRRAGIEGLLAALRYLVGRRV